MWDRDGDGIPEVPTNWRDYTSEGCGGCGCGTVLVFVVVIIAAYLLVTA